MYLRNDYLQGSGPAEWNCKTPIHPRQDFTLKRREGSSVFSGLSINRKYFYTETSVNICHVKELEYNYALNLIYIHFKMLLFKIYNILY